jgi:D-threo-aldose 1-dehydrogenase
VSSIPTRAVGRTDVQVTELGLGGAPLGDLFVRLSDDDADAVLRAAWDAGVRYFDTAPEYGHGQSEHRVGRFLRTVPREELVLSTKAGRLLRVPRGRVDPGFWVGGLPFEGYFDYGYDGVMRSYEDSLQRLGLTRVDIVLVHDLDLRHHGDERTVNTHLDALETGGMRALEELRRAGDIRAVGAGVNDLGTIPRFLERVDLDLFIVAMPYTLLHQEALDEELPLCEERGVGVVVGAPFQSGILAGDPAYNYGDAPPEIVERVERLRAVCAGHGVPLAAAALRFPLAHPSVAAVIPGAVRPEQVRENAEHLRRAIPVELWAELKAEGLLRADAPVP